MEPTQDLAAPALKDPWFHLAEPPQVSRGARTARVIAGDTQDAEGAHHWEVHLPVAPPTPAHAPAASFT